MGIEYSFNENKDNLIGEGAHGAVYRLNQNYKMPLVGKFLYDYVLGSSIDFSPEKIFELNEEYKIQKELYEAGINVPKPFGIYLIKNQSDFVYYPGFVMEFIEGIGLNYLKYFNPSFLPNLRKLRDVEIEKAKNLDLIPCDARRLENVIWVPEKEKVYLIDFGMWERRK